MKVLMKLERVQMAAAAKVLGCSNATKKTVPKERLIMYPLEG